MTTETEKRVCVLVLGMHRSGTSVIASVVRSLGVDFGNQLLLSGDDNPRGYFEHAEIVAINQSLLESFEIDSDGITQELPKDWLYDERVASYKEKIRSVIRRDFSTSNYFGLKDPRISILLPLYLEILDELCVDVRCVVAHRTIADVVFSMRSRNNVPLITAAKAFRYFYRIIGACGGEYPSINIFYSDLLGDSQNVVQMLCTFLHDEATCVDAYIADAVARIEPQLQHQQKSIDELLRAYEHELEMVERQVSEQRATRQNDLLWWENQLQTFRHIEHHQIEIIERANTTHAQMMDEREASLRKHREEMNELKSVHKHSFEEAEGQWKAIVADKERYIASLQTTLAHIERSIVWKVITVWDGVFMHIFPKHSHVYRWYHGGIMWLQRMCNDVIPGKVVETIKGRQAAKNVSSFWDTFFAATPQTDILFVNHEESRTGAPRIVFDVAQASKKRHSVAMVSLKKESMHQDFVDAFGTIIYPDDLYPTKKPEEQARMILEKLRPRLVYVNSISSYAFAKVAKEMSIPVIFHVHELDIAFNVYFSKRQRDDFKHWADTFIAVSEPVRTLLVDTLGCDADKVVLINAFINGERVRQQAKEIESSYIRRELQLEDDTLLVVCVGMFIYRKGADMFMELAKRMIDRGLKVKLVWVGGQPFKEPFMGDFATYRDYFTLLSEKKNPFPYVQLADVFILPAREDPFPLVVLEAMALSKPTVVFKDAGGIHEAIQDAGVIVSPMTVDAFEDALVTCITDKGARDMYGLRAKIHQQKYDAHYLLPQVQTCIKETLQQQQQPLL